MTHRVVRPCPMRLLGGGDAIVSPINSNLPQVLCPLKNPTVNPRTAAVTKEIAEILYSLYRLIVW